MKPITTAIATVLALITIGAPVSAQMIAVTDVLTPQELSTDKLQIEQLLTSLDLTPVTVCVQIQDDCIDIGSGAIHNKSKTLLTAKHVLLGEGWFVINGLRIESNSVVFKVKSNGTIIKSLSYNKAALPASQFQQGPQGIGKDLAVMYYNQSQLDTLKESARTWNLPKGEADLSLLVVKTSLNQKIQLQPTLLSYRTRDSLGELTFDTGLHKMDMRFTGAKLAAYEDIIFGNEFISIVDGQILVSSYNSASGQEAFQAFTLPYGQSIEDNVKGLINETNGVNPTGPGTSGSAVIGKVDSKLILGAFVAMNSAQVDIKQAVVGVISTPKLAKDYQDLGSSDDLGELAVYRSLFPPSAVMIWTMDDFESL
jgi:hypothetical protein